METTQKCNHNFLNGFAESFGMLVAFTTIYREFLKEAWVRSGMNFVMISTHSMEFGLYWYHTLLKSVLSSSRNWPTSRWDVIITSGWAELNKGISCFVSISQRRNYEIFKKLHGMPRVICNFKPPKYLVTKWDLNKAKTVLISPFS